MRFLLLGIIIILAVLGFLYYRDGSFALEPSAACDEIRSHRNVEISTTATSITVSQPSYTDGIRYFFGLCFLE